MKITDDMTNGAMGWAPESGRRWLQIRFTEARYYCPKCGMTISNGYRGSLCFHGGNGASARMKPALDKEQT